jgi:hypothetical protein
VIANLYRCLPDDMLDHAIGKLERLVRSLDRQGTLPRLADDYRRALDLARQERARRLA